MRWIQDGLVEGWATKEVNQDSLDSQMDGCHANRGNLHLMLSLAQDNNGGDPDLLPTGEIKPRH